MFGTSVQSEVFSRREIANTLLAAEQASGAALRATVANDDPFGEGYKTGYQSALTTIALAFGLIPANSGTENRGWRLLR